MSEQSQEPGRADRREQELPPYYRAARFRGERPAGRAYGAAQALLFATEECELSAYRFHLDRIWHVVVLGDTPSADLAEKLEAVLATGESTSLPPQVLGVLMERRRRATEQGPWVERHHRPGLHLEPS